MADNEMDRGSAKRAAQPPAEALSTWVKETRSRASSSELPEPAPLPVLPWRRRLRIGLRVGAFLALGWCFWTWGQDTFRTTTAVRGKLSDREGRPVAGIWVFLAADPKVETTTDQDGVFNLPGVPLGPQILVAAQDGAGQEVRFHASSQTATDLGDLAYRVPPLCVRTSPGGGAYWQQP
jgi:carboxypeptidase family protein